MNRKVTLPRKNWKVSSREYFTYFMQSQGSMLRVLMENIYFNLEGILGQAPRINFAVSNLKQACIIGGQRYSARPDGAAVIGPRDRRVPIISFVGWYEGQTWCEFLSEVLSIMLGQLAGNVTGKSQDQAVFVGGFHRLEIYIALHTKGCSEDESFDLQSTRGYNLILKEDWLEATHGLTRLLRYMGMQR
ncbi:hypothetical protein BDV29DRAFT_187045 [Aspergillus leporis]|uniref:Fungal-type protein kinase domain-containing protein n=1 Tax=Aspergillus leporis TaxID=41062 RepID=A0A5N5XG53_9EURO|nr:hypothetical protein BDV29DRAFT_187045 [Aspergillus leporis]